MARILLENVTKVFDGKITAVSDIDLEVADGEFMVIVGPSGCGKTTTLRMIAGLEEVTAGSIYIGEMLANDVPPRDRDIAMVFQNYALYPHMTVRQNMAFALKMRKVSRGEIRKRIKEAAELLGIERLLNRKPKALSGGQRQRVAVGRAIVRNPSAFLFDEPLSNLDARLRLAMRAELKDLHRRLQTTTIYVTHDQAEGMSLGERICVMNDGVIQQIANPVGVYDRPANKFVAGFLGTPPMNFLTGRVESEGDTLHFAIGGDAVALPPRLKTMLSEYRDKEMILGVRPEDISLSQFQGQVDNTISATVGLIEPVGARTDVHLANDTGQKFVTSIDPHAPPAVGDAANIYINLERIHIFEPEETGRNVTLARTTEPTDPK
ncbi:MAG: sn-glycerol-3-phosphate ABC transporter ATP-binding protein UgpC [Planctomycetota bacterium]|nr:sn-glycerol-3-phosphate ABC transporter ATP-binding protein UgpC [Planctomycetota bacterium]